MDLIERRYFGMRHEQFSRYVEHIYLRGPVIGRPQRIPHILAVHRIFIYWQDILIVDRATPIIQEASLPSATRPLLRIGTAFPPLLKP